MHAIYSTTMSEQYDEIADLYHETIQEIPFRQHAETVTLFGSLGDVQGLSALDLACGIGAATTRVSERGLALFGRDDWQPYRDQPHALCLEATRP